MWLSSGFWNGEIILDYPGGPNAITRVQQERRKSESGSSKCPLEGGTSSGRTTELITNWLIWWTISHCVDCQPLSHLSCQGESRCCLLCEAGLTSFIPSTSDLSQPCLASVPRHLPCAASCSCPLGLGALLPSQLHSVQVVAQCPAHHHSGKTFHKYIG